MVTSSWASFLPSLNKEGVAQVAGYSLLTGRAALPSSWPPFLGPGALNLLWLRRWNRGWALPFGSHIPHLSSRMQGQAAPPPSPRNNLMPGRLCRSLRGERKKLRPEAEGWPLCCEPPGFLDWGPGPAPPRGQPGVTWLGWGLALTPTVTSPLRPALPMRIYFLVCHISSTKMVPGTFPASL